MHPFTTGAVLALGCFVVLANCAPRLNTKRTNAVCRVEGRLLRQMRHKVHVLSRDAERQDEDTDTRLVGKELFRGLEESGSCYVLREVIDFYLITVLNSDELQTRFPHLDEVKGFLAVLMKRHMSDCDTEEKTVANENIDRLKQKVGQLGEASKAKVVGELFILLQEIGSRCSTAGR